MPRVLNKHCAFNPPDAVYIGRPSVYGNPFIIGRDGSREKVIEKYREWFAAKDEETKARLLAAIKGKDLVCHCAPKACHGDVLIELANQEE